MTEPAVNRLRDHAAWAASLRDYSKLGPIASFAMDVDYLKERRGHFIVVESKRWAHGLHVPTGEHVTLKALASLPCFTVYLVGEVEPDEQWPYRIMRYTPDARGARSARGGGELFLPYQFDRMNLAEYVTLIERWWESVGR